MPLPLVSPWPPPQLSRGASAKKIRSAPRTQPDKFILLGVVVSGVIGIIFGILAPHILRAMGAAESIVTLGTTFARVMLGGNATVFLIFLINAVFRGAGDAVIAMRRSGSPMQSTSSSVHVSSLAGDLFRNAV
jgi:hypothetical protein